MNLFIVPAMVRTSTITCSIQVIEAQSREIINSFPYQTGNDEDRMRAYSQALEYAERVKNENRY